MTAAGFEVVEDSLGLMASEATDLLRRVDLVIEHLGTPAQHPLPELLRKLRVRPGEALRMLLAASPADLMTSVDRLRELATAYHDDLVAPLDRAAGRLGWSGSGYQAFSAYWGDQMRHLATGEDAESMAGRLRATADFVESVAGWFSQTRRAMAGALIETFGSTEAVTLKSCEALDHDPAGLRGAVVTGELSGSHRLVAAAADIGAVTLSSVATWYDDAVESFVAGPDGVPAGGWDVKLADLSPPAPDGGTTHGYAEGVWLRT